MLFFDGLVTALISAYANSFQTVSSCVQQYQVPATQVLTPFSPWSPCTRGAFTKIEQYNWILSGENVRSQEREFLQLKQQTERYPNDFQTLWKDTALFYFCIKTSDCSSAESWAP